MSGARNHITPITLSLSLLAVILVLLPIAAEASNAVMMNYLCRQHCQQTYSMCLRTASE
jgi:hypothetical protein